MLLLWLLRPPWFSFVVLLSVYSVHTTKAGNCSHIPKPLVGTPTGFEMFLNCGLERSPPSTYALQSTTAFRVYKTCWDGQCHHLRILEFRAQALLSAIVLSLLLLVLLLFLLVLFLFRVSTGIKDFSLDLTAYIMTDELLCKLLVVCPLITNPYNTPLYGGFPK